jgi:hypothetical protein
MNRRLSHYFVMDDGEGKWDFTTPGCCHNGFSKNEGNLKRLIIII